MGELPTYAVGNTRWEMRGEMRIAVELVLRNKDKFAEELKTVKDNFQTVETINIPDLMRYPLRSWEGCQLAKKYFPSVIPHIRAFDIDEHKPFGFKDMLTETKTKEVLVIAGDCPPESAKSPCQQDTLSIIRKFKQDLPGIKVYAGFDQYRTSFEEEYEYAKRKIDAGAEGFFTQPFFDMRLLEKTAQLLKGKAVFFGVSPVVNLRTKEYWQTKNNVAFTGDFCADLEWNRCFAQRVIQFVKKNNFNIYFMPIRLNIKEYLSGIIS